MALGKVCRVSTPTSGVFSVSILKYSTSFKHSTSLIPIVSSLRHGGGLFHVWRSHFHDALHSLAIPVRIRSPCCWFLITPNANWQGELQPPPPGSSAHDHGSGGVASSAYQQDLALFWDLASKGMWRVCVFQHTNTINKAIEYHHYCQLDSYLPLDIWFVRNLLLLSSFLGFRGKGLFTSVVQHKYLRLPWKDLHFICYCRNSHHSCQCSCNDHHSLELLHWDTQRGSCLPTIFQHVCQARYTEARWCHPCSICRCLQDVFRWVDFLCLQFPLWDMNPFLACRNL